jgi:hypothetical protein
MGNRGDDVDIKNVDGEGLTVGWTQSGEWLAYTVEVQHNGPYATTFRIANGLDTPTRFHLEVDGTNVSGPIAVVPTGAWTTQATISGPTLSLTQGAHTFKVVFDTDHVDLNWFRLSVGQ